MNKLKATILGIALISGTSLMAQDQPEKGFEKWDTNKDGGIDKAEFLAMKKAKAEKRAADGKEASTKAKDPDKQFASIDTDKNGLISKAEMEAKKEQKAQAKKKKTISSKKK